MWHLNMLGPFQAQRGLDVYLTFRTRKTGALLAYLACRRHPQPREALIARFWPDSERKSGQASLRSELTWLRSRFNRFEPPLVRSDRYHLGLDPVGYTIDVADFERLIGSSLRREGPSPIPGLQQALALYRGDFLAGYHDYDSDCWIARERQRLKDVRLEAMHLLADLLEQEGDLRAALEAALAASVADPTHVLRRQQVFRLSQKVGYLRTAIQHSRELRAAAEQGLIPDNLPSILLDLHARFETMEAEQQSVTQEEQDTLRQALALSLRRMSERLRCFTCRLACFPGDFTAEMAALLCRETQAAALIAKLKEIGLVRDSEQAHAPRPPSWENLRIYPDETPPKLGGVLCGARSGGAVERVGGRTPDQDRFYLLPLMRQYASTQIVPEEQEHFAGRLAEFLLERETLYRYDPARDRREEWLERVRLAEPDFEMALEWALTSGHDPGRGQRLLALIQDYWKAANRESVGRRWAEIALDSLESPVGNLRSDLLLMAGEMAQGMGDPAGALEYYQQAMDGARQDADRLRIARSQLAMGQALHHLVRDREAYTAFQSALSLFRTLNRPPDIARTLACLSDTLLFRGEVEEARRCCEEGVEIFRSAREGLSLAPLLFLLGRMRRRQGDYPQARQALNEGLQLCVDLRERHGEADCLQQLGLLHLDQGFYAEARSLIEQAIHLYTDLGKTESRAAALGSLGDACLPQERLEEAQRHYREGLAVWKERGHPRWSAIFLMRLATLALYQQEVGQARSFCAEAERIAPEPHAPLTRAAILRLKALLALQQAQSEAAWSLALESLQIRHRNRHRLQTVETLETLAQIALRRQRADQTASLLGTAEQERARMGTPRTAREQSNIDFLIQQGRALLSPSCWQTAWNQGQETPLDQAVARL